MFTIDLCLAHTRHGRFELVEEIVAVVLIFERADFFYFLIFLKQLAATPVAFSDKGVRVKTDTKLSILTKIRNATDRG
jgi:fructoselysine-6-P-deglycase FrlB-like protein